MVRICEEGVPKMRFQAKLCYSLLHLCRAREWTHTRIEFDSPSLSLVEYFAHLSTPEFPLEVSLNGDKGFRVKGKVPLESIEALVKVAEQHKGNLSMARPVGLLYYHELDIDRPCSAPCKHCNATNVIISWPEGLVNFSKPIVITPKDGFGDLSQFDLPKEKTTYVKTRSGSDYLMRFFFENQDLVSIGYEDDYSA